MQKADQDPKDIKGVDKAKADVSAGKIKSLLEEEKKKEDQKDKFRTEFINTSSSQGGR